MEERYRTDLVDLYLTPATASAALDAAAEALQPALSLSASQRISEVSTRLAAVRDELAAPVFRGSAQARALGEQIEEFGRETIVAGLHSLPGGPG